jgi:hypothetical protein
MQCISYRQGRAADGSLICTDVTDAGGACFYQCDPSDLCCNNRAGYHIKKGVLYCCKGTNNPCCGKRIDDPCCRNPDSLFCKKCGGAGSGDAVNNAQFGE